MAKRGFLRESGRPGTDPPRGSVGLERTSGEMARTTSASSDQPTETPDGPENCGNQSRTTVCQTPAGASLGGLESLVDRHEPSNQHELSSRHVRSPHPIGKSVWSS
jgi:hypothetical protein